MSNADWKPFPPPGPGLYDIRDRTGLMSLAVEVERNSRGKLKAWGMLCVPTMVAPHCSLNYEWRPASGNRGGL